jgi:hypothetical protein
MHAEETLNVKCKIALRTVFVLMVILEMRLKAVLKYTVMLKLKIYAILLRAAEMQIVKTVSVIVRQNIKEILT